MVCSALAHQLRPGSLRESGKLQQTLTQGCLGRQMMSQAAEQHHGGSCSTCPYLLSSRGPGSLMRLGSCLSNLESTRSSSRLSLPLINGNDQSSGLPADT